MARAAASVFLPAGTLAGCARRGRIGLEAMLADHNCEQAGYQLGTPQYASCRMELARRANVVIKVSGACTLSRESYPFPDIWDPLARVFDAWGFERCLWGTDWTRAFAVVNYEQAVEPFVKTSRLSDTERAMLMGGACAKAYRWSPKG